MSDTISVIQIGLGPIGQRMTKRILSHPRLKLVGAVDLNPQYRDQDAGLVSGMPNPAGVPIVSSLDQVTAEAQIACVMTSSSLPATAPTLHQCIARSLHVVSTCEELAFPHNTHPQLAAELDHAAIEAAVVLLGTGVNPGFVMDTLPLTLTGACERVDAIRVERYQDAGKRRLPFQLKVGASLSPQEFDRQVAAGKIRHVGLTESMHMLAARLGWALDRTQDTIEPIIAHEPIQSPDLHIAPGHVRGVHQVGKAWVGDELVIELVFHAAVGQAKPQDRIVIRGEPSFESVIPGGIHGDIATCALAINCLPLALTAWPGLRTMADIDPVSCFQ